MKRTAMQTENWETIKGILDDALRVAPSERAALLERAAGSAEIRAEVESLLACDAESANFMSLPITDFSKDFSGGGGEAAEISLVGQSVGIYEIVGEIGFGGMGAVYSAERRDGKFAQRVAIKMLKREYNTERIRRSFRRERKIQSKLNHPNIARLFDAGTTADGVPFLVMEFIEGEPIDKFCGRGNLSLTARLKLFNRVCDGVMNAHRNLIVHRDLKPSNILVTEDGEPKLLDFGISKLLDAEGGEDRRATTLLGAMTPEYASPEQIKGEPVTTAADIYSLGVVLFKILTGGSPYNFKNLTNGNLLKEITDTEPTLPSAALREEKTMRQRDDATVSQAEILSDGQNKIAPSHRPAVSPSELKGDLDNIILKSLSKEPTQRYQTVEQFAADIWRYIDGLPVLARPVTFSYQASKFYRRNRISVLAAAFVALSLLTGLTAALWQAQVARGQARIAGDARQQAELETTRALSEEEKARAEKERAEKISRFMMKILNYANPQWYAEGSKYKGETKVIEAMEELRDKIEIEFAGQTDVQAELHHKFAEVYLSNGGNGRMEEAQVKSLYHARRALELRREFYGERHELVAKDLFYLYVAGGIERKEQAKHLMEAIQMMRETNPHNLNLPYMFESFATYLMMPDSEALHEQYRRAVNSPTDENKYQIAERFMLEAIPIFREHYKEDNQAIYENECRVAYAQLKQDKSSEAAPHLEVCRAGATKMPDESRKYFLTLIEEAAAQANR